MKKQACLGDLYIVWVQKGSFGPWLKYVIFVHT